MEHSFTAVADLILSAISQRYLSTPPGDQQAVH